MKIIFLNTWNGRMKNEIVDFIKLHKSTTDVFCFQEVYDGDFRKLIIEILAGFTEIWDYKKGPTDESGNDDYAVATFVNRSLKIASKSSLFDEPPGNGLGISTDVEKDGKIFHVLNYHGISRPKDKLDNEARISQTQKIINYYKKFSEKVILGGDFNFLPQTDSYENFIKDGYRELILTNNISTTRNKLYWDNRPQTHLYSDYIFTSKDVEIKMIEVPKIEISDHLPMILEINS